MFKTNKETVQGYYEELTNKKLFDRYDDYYTEDSVYHNPPYVGLGVSNDDSSGDKVIIFEVAKGCPADGHLLPGDQLLRVADGNNVWETYKELREPWGQGIVGTTISIRVLRDGQTLDLQLTRGIVQGFDQRALDFKERFRYYLTKVWPDQKVTIKHLIEEGDLVVAHCLCSGTNVEYNRQAIWEFIEILRIKDGKILESWNVEDAHSEMRQLGYKILPPE